MKNCKCGSTQFAVVETLVHEGELINGKIKCFKNFSNEIESITCKNCGEEILPSKIEVIFNY